MYGTTLHVVGPRDPTSDLDWERIEMSLLANCIRHYGLHDAEVQRMLGMMRMRHLDSLLDHLEWDATQETLQAILAPEPPPPERSAFARLALLYGARQPWT